VRIAVDARELQGHATGVGTYLAGILDEWTALPSAAAHEFVLCSPAAIDVPLTRSGHASNLTAGGHGSWWEQRTLPRLVRHAAADVLFAPGYTAPILSPVPTVVAIHDVSFAAHPEWFPWREGLRRRVLTRLSARRAARVITISEFSKQEIARHLGIRTSRIDVIYPAVAAVDASRTREVPSRTILYSGSLFNRRHIPELIEGFARLARTMPAARLEIVGDNRTVPRLDVERLVGASGVGDRIGLRSYLPQQELAARYRDAGAFVFLSAYEGFGFTPLEALSAGVPIVVLDTPVAREVYGSAALYVARPDPPLIEAALTRILTDEGERTRILAEARHTLARYSWRTCAERVLDALVSCCTCLVSQ
jgi:glycosyltransferase involved in cell wall biosynthesis